MPGHDTSSFVSRDLGLAGVIRWKKFCAAERLRRMPAGFRPHSTAAVSLPNTTRTEERSPRKSAVLRLPRKSAVLRPPRKSAVLRPPKNNTNAETYGEPQTPAEPR